MTAGLAPLWTRFKTELAADKKRTAILGVLLLVFCGVLGRMLIGEAAPASAVAQTAVAVAVASTTPAVTSAPNPAAVTPSVRPTLEAAPVARPEPFADAPPSAAQPPAQPLTPDTKPVKPVEIDPGPKQVTRDLFASSAWSSFPAARNSSSTQPSEEDNEPGFWGRLAVGLSDRGMAQRGEILRVEKLAQKLRLEATMSGSSPAAYISGRLVHVGDTISTFSVVAIEDRSVTVALDGHHVSLRIP